MTNYWYDTFSDECLGRGYAHKAIFAGVQTGYKDSEGSFIYTGDVICVEDKDGSQPYNIALGTIGFGEQGGEYAFMLDNHSLYLKECFRQEMKLTRVGTVFFQLDNNAPQETVARRASSFNMSRTEEGIVLMARYTPNFDQEEWKYKALELIGAEFNWNK